MINGKGVPTKAVAGLAKELGTDVRYPDKLAEEIRKGSTGQLTTSKAAVKIQQMIEREATASGHVLHPWTRNRWGHHTTCKQCGAFVGFTVSSKKFRERERIQAPCEHPPDPPDGG